MQDNVPELGRNAQEIDADEIGQAGHAPDILAEHMRSEFEAQRIGQRVFEDEFLFDRTVEALRFAEGSGGLEFERPVALLADVRALEEAEQVLGVEHIEGIVRLSRLGRLIVVRRSEGGGASDCKRDAKTVGARGADADRPILASVPSQRGA